MNDWHDVIIIGAGPAGSAAAHYLAKSGLDVVLLDKFDFPRDKTCGDALGPNSLKILHDMGILHDVLQIGFRLNGVEIFAPRGHSVAAPVPKQEGLPNYGLVAPRVHLDNVIRERAVASGAQFQGPVHVTDVATTGDHVEVSGESRGQPVTFKGRIAIIAIGASVKLLLQMGLLRQAPRMMVASRAYYEGVHGLTDKIHLRFDGVPLPGYGWVFPVSDSAANVGAGFYRVGPTARWMPDTSKEAFDKFIQIKPLQEMIGQARRVGPVKGYPLRVDFPTAPTFGERVLLVGESAGLVNPLTGEGIDFALESGKMAAGYLAHQLAVGDLSRAGLQEYDRLLRQRFQRLFVFLHRLRGLFMNHLMLDPLLYLAAHRPDLKMFLIDIAAGTRDVPTDIGLRSVLKVATGR
jgi:menaquinone-9 beta-reductase